MRRFVIGRNRGEATIVVGEAHSTVSNVHAELSVNDAGECFLADLKSTNGTEILWRGDWKRVSGSREQIDPDQEMRLGRRFRTTPRQLLAMAGHEGLIEGRRTISTPVSKPKPRPKGKGKPRFNPETGEIVFD